MKRSNEKKLRMALVAFVLGALTMPTVSVVRAETYTGSDTVTVDAETKEIKVKNMTQVEDENSLALGASALADGTRAFAVGNSAIAQGENAAAFGNGSQATGKNATAFGVNSYAQAEETAALGYYNFATGQYSVAIGSHNDASRTGGTSNAAIGSQNEASGETQSVAIGVLNKATQTTATAVGKGNNAYAGNSAAVGISNKAGAEGATYYSASAFGISNNATAEKASAFGYSNSASGLWSSAFGYSSKASGKYASAVGLKNEASGTLSAAYGFFNTATGKYASALGGYNTAVGENATATGEEVAVYGANSASFGYKNTVGAATKGTDGTITADTAKGNDSYVFGASNIVTANNAIVLGTNVTTVADNSVVIGDQSTSEDANTVSVGYTGGERKIVHVADGTVNTDAATYGQIAKTEQVITLSTDTRDTVNEKDIKGNEIAANDGTVLATFTKVGETLTANDTGFVSGGDLYTEVRPTGSKKVDGVGDYEYIDKDQTTAQNLISLDAAIAENKYQGSDTISIAKADGDTAYTVKVKNMAMSTAATDEAVNGTTKAQGENAVAFGVGAEALAKDAQAFGTGAQVYSDTTLSSYGATGQDGIAIGTEAKTSGSYGIALGKSASAGVGGTIAIGAGAQVYVDSSISASLGAIGLYGIAIGYNAKTSGAQGVAVGYKALASVGGTTAVGREAQAIDLYATAIGAKAQANENESVAAGYTALAKGTFSVAIGSGSQAGARQSLAIGYQAAASADETIAIGRYSKASGSESAVVGGGAIGAGVYSTAIGNSAEAAGQATAAFGSASVALGESATALGNGAKAYANYSIALGRNATVGIESERNADGSSKGNVAQESRYGIAIGDGSQASAFFTLALGPGAYASGTFSNAIGYQSYATAKGAVAIGMQSVASVATAKETLTDGTSANVSTVSFGHQNGDAYKAYDEGTHTHSSVEERYTDVALSRLTNVAEGKADTDAVNFSQIETVARSGNEEKNGVYIQSSLTDGALNADGTVGKNLAALDAKAVAVTAVNTVSLSTDARDTAKTEQGKKNEIVANDGTVLATFTAMEEVSDTDTGFVSGADLYKEVRPVDGDIVKNGKTTAENLKALEEALAGNAYQGSDTISISKAEGDTAYTVKVKNMAMSEEVEAAASAPTAVGLNAIAFGVGAKASGDYTMVLGHGSEAEGEGATALGADNNVKGQYSVAIGTMNTASSSGGTTSEGTIEEDEVALNAAIGAGNYATGPYYSSAVGVQNSATAAQAVAYGYYNQATGEGASAVGGANTVSGMYATAVGSNNVATGQMATAIGYGNQAVNNMSMAIGTSATATGEGATAIGYQAAASVGPKTESGNTVLTVSFGHDPDDIDPTTLTEETPAGMAYGTTVLSRLTHVADGKSITDAANFGQIAKTGQTVNLGTTTTTVNGKTITANQVAANNGTVLATFTKVGDTLTASDTGFVSGADLYKETREEITSTNYIAKGNTAGANLNALAEKIGEEKGVTDVYDATDTVEDQIYKVANTRVAKDQTVSLATTSGTNATNVIKDADGNVLVTMAAGTVSSGNNNFVSGGQVWANDVKNQSYDVQGDGTVTIKNNANGTAFTITGIGSGSSIVIGDGAESAHWVDLVWNGAVDDDNVTRGMNSAAYGYQANASGEAATALGYNAQAGGVNSVALGSGSVAEEDEVVSVGGGDVAARRIINVANGTSNSDAATYGQTFKAATVELTSTKNTITSHDGETTVTFKMGAVSNNNTGFISGGQLYTEGRVKGTDYHALDKANTIAQNLEALDAALGNNTSMVVGDEDTHALDISWNQESGEAAGRGTNSAAYGYQANASGEGAVALGYNAKAGGVNSVALGSGSVAEEDNVISVGGGDVETRKIVNVAYGADSHDAAAVGQLIAGASNATSTDKTKAQTATLTFKDTTQTALTIEVPGQGTVDASDQRLVSGATLYGETRNAIATTNQTLHYVSEQDAANNLLALDKAIGKTAKGKYISAQDGDSVTVATNLAELDQALKDFDETRNDLVSYDQTGKQIQIGSGVEADTISAGARRITNVTAGTADTDAVNKKQLDTAIAGTNYTAGNDYVTVDNAARTISVDVSGAVSSGNTGIVTGGTVYNSIVKNATYSVNSDKKTVTVKNGANQTAFTLDLDGLADEGVTYEAGNYISISDANQISVDVSGAVSSGDTGIVTGGTVYNSIVKNATYSVNSDKKTVTVKNGANQTAFTLDLSGLPSGSGSGVTYEAGDHISISSDNKISVTADGAVAKNNSGLVTGGTVYDAIQTQIGQITPYTGDDETIAVTDKKISAKTGEIGSGVKTLVTGDTAYQALVKNATYSLNDDKKTITVKNGADQTAFTLNLDGLAGGSGTTYEAGDHISISSDNVISVKTDGKIESGNTGIVTGGAIYEKVGDTTKLSEVGLGENLTDSVLNVNSRIGRLDNDISKAGAGAAALAALRPEAFNPSDKVSFALGYGHYRGTSAGAFGAFYKPNADTTLSVGATIGNSDSMMNAGISFKLGSRGQGLGLYSPNVDLVRQVNALRVDNELLKADNARMKQQIALILANMEMSGTVRKSVKE